jgi:hypothetical protein
MDQLSTDKINASESQGGAQRNAPRDSLLLTGGFRLKGSDRVEQVRIRNLSAGGLMAEVADDMDRNAEVEIEVRGIGWIAGRIAWQAMGRVGIAFDREIDPKKARKPVGGGTRTPEYAKPKL